MNGIITSPCMHVPSRPSQCSDCTACTVHTLSCAISLRVITTTPTRATLFLITNCRTRDNKIHYTFHKSLVINWFVITNIVHYFGLLKHKFLLDCYGENTHFLSASWQLGVRYINPSAQRATAGRAAVGLAGKLVKACVARASCRRCFFQSEMRISPKIKSKFLRKSQDK